MSKAAVFVPGIAKKQCVICSAPLSVHDLARGETCASPRCRGSQLRREVDRQEKDRAELVRRTHNWLTELVPGIAADQQPVVAVVPSNDRKLVNLSARKRSRFRDRLMRKIGEAAANRARAGALKTGGTARQADDPHEDGANDPSIDGVIGNACATCQGQCCWQGGEHAFIHTETIEAYMAANPLARPRDVLAAYLDRITDKVYADSCVYHGPDGCGLTREMRSSLCNDFQCKGLNALTHGLGGRESMLAFVAAESDGGLRRARLIRGESVLIQSDVRHQAGVSSGDE